MIGLLNVVYRCISDLVWSFPLISPSQLPVVHVDKLEKVIFFHFLSFISNIMSIPVAEQILESEYFNWRCVICSDLAKSPLHIESQHQVEHGPHTDLDGALWVKCEKCEAPFHVRCLTSVPKIGPYICTFFQCKT